MPYFYDVDTFSIVWRDHEFNVEALDGDIIKVEDEEPCYIIGHSPTKSFSYEVFIKEETTPEKGFEMLDKMPSERSDDGNLYYKLIPKSQYREYLDNFNLKENKSLHHPQSEDKDKKKSVAEADIKKITATTDSSNVSTRKKDKEEEESKDSKFASSVSGYSGVKLMRDSEKSII